MALCRCLDDHSPPESDDYIAYVEPLGYPNSALICGRPAKKNSDACEKIGVIWLNRKELEKYLTGTRIFAVTRVVKMLAKNNDLHYI